MKKIFLIVLLAFYSFPIFAQIIENPPSFTYPANADEVMATTSDDKILLFAYGSLINPESAKRSMSKEAIESGMPVIAYHLIRVFDLPSNKLKTIDRGMLNVHPTSSPNSIVNGILYKIDKNDLKNLIFREDGYDLIPVIVEPWPSNPEGHFAIAYTFSASEEPRNGIRYTDDSIMPNINYYNTVRIGVEKFGPDFLKLWNETTYLGDRRTLAVKTIDPDY